MPIFRAEFIDNPSNIKDPVMRTATCERAQRNHGISRRFCRKLHTAVSRLKKQLIARYEATPASTRQIREALTAAETQAWETSFPHLFFPDLAEVHLATLTAQNEPAPRHRS
jgi:hypothetical protein